MAIAFQAVAPRSPTRLRLVFSEALAAGAFVTGFYSLQTLDDAGTAPAVQAALVVPGAASNIELVLATPLVPGAAYQVDVASGVPASAGGTGAAASAALRLGAKPPDPSADVRTADVIGLVFGIDLAHDGNDFIETTEGDLAEVTGMENLKGACVRRVLSEGLPWAPGYGAKPRRRVDGSPAGIPSLRGDVVAQLRSDDRVRGAEAVAATDENDGTAVIDITIDAVGALRAEVAARIERA